MIEQVSGQIQRAFTMAGIHGDQSFNQTEFVDVYRKAVLALAQCLREKPLTVAYSEKMFDGSSITALLKDKPALDAVSIQSLMKNHFNRFFHFLCKAMVLCGWTIDKFTGFLLFRAPVYNVILMARFV